MHVISVVAVNALYRLLLLRIQRFEMTTMAMNIFMGSSNLEIRIVVIECPDQPVIRVMAAIAIFSQRLLVEVIVLVTVVASRSRILECGR